MYRTRFAKELAFRGKVFTIPSLSSRTRRLFGLAAQALCTSQRAGVTSPGPSIRVNHNHAWKRRPALRSKWIFASLVSFIALTVASSLLAQNVATKITNLPLIPAGTTALTRPGLSTIPSDDLRIKPSKDAERGEEISFSQGLQFPQASPSKISSAPSFFGFAGLTHVDQRLAGTGAYTNTQFSTEPPDQGLAAGNGFILEAVNDALAAYDQRTGSVLVGPTALNQFFNLAPEIVRPNGPFGDFLSDPRCYFDRQLRR